MIFCCVLVPENSHILLGGRKKKDTIANHSFEVAHILFTFGQHIFTIEVIYVVHKFASTCNVNKIASE